MVVIQGFKFKVVFSGDKIAMHIGNRTLFLYQQCTTEGNFKAAVGYDGYLVVMEQFVPKSLGPCIALVTTGS